MEEIYGSTNGPQSNTLPHLTYKYKMNEPFLGGEVASIQDSHDQAKFKIADTYGTSSEIKTSEQEKQEWVTALSDQFEL